MPSGSELADPVVPDPVVPDAGATPEVPEVIDTPETPAVVVEHLTVRFRTKREGGRSLALHLRSRKRDRRIVTALDDVSFEVPTGTVYAVIGTNGAGKSTLLRVIGGIFPPVEGRIVLHSEPTPLLSLGVGFNRRLTGRENILLGGLARGLDRERVEANMDTVIEFSELGDAIDYPMRTYSSGMSSRLGFSVAVHLEPELILIDEALAAGDAHFKKKSMAKIVELCEQELCTVILVSHGLGLVEQLADRCLWLEGGKVMADGPTPEVVDGYLEAQQASEDDLAAMEDI